MDSLSKVLSDNNIVIRQQVTKDSIGPEPTANRLDAAAVYANNRAPFQKTTDADGLLIGDELIGRGIIQISGAGTILDCTIHFNKKSETNFVADVSDDNIKLILVPNYPYTLTPIL